MSLVRRPHARTALLATGLLAAFVATRLALLWRFPPFTDEALYAHWAWQGYQAPEERFVALASGKEPLLPWAAMGWMRLGADPLTAVRLVSMTAGCVAVGAVALVARDLFGTAAAWAAAALAVLLPFFLVYEAVGIYEALAAATVAVALLLQLRLARRPSLANALLLGLVAGAALLTKSTTLFLFALLPLGVLVFDWGPERRSRRLLEWIAATALALVVAGLVHAVLLLSELYDDYRAARLDVAPVHSLGDGIRDVGRWLDQNVPPYLEALIGYVTLPVLVVAVVGFVAALRRDRGAALFVAAWALVPFAGAVLVADVPHPRYLLTGVPPIVVFAGFGFVSLAAAVRDRPRLALAATLLVLPALVFDARVVASPTDATYPSLDDGQFATSWAAGAPWPPLADELRTRAGDRPALVVLGEHHPLAVLLLLLDTPSITVVRDDDARAGAARFAVENDEPLPELPGALRRRAVWTYERPRDGDTATLYEIGVEVEGRFHATPEDLRAGLALGDAEFDAFIALFPEIRRWYRGWFGDYG